ncbi:MAG: ROK family protein [Spirochaetales bacterium]|nr:ROK family protein [Spirochaetales bacterium]
MTHTSAKPKNIRKNNFILLLNLYRQNTSLSVTKISQIASLSRTTVNKINESLIEKKLIIPLGKGESTEFGGKKPNIYTLNSCYGYVLCFVVAMQKVEVKVYDMQMREVYKSEEKIVYNASFDKIIQRVKKHWDFFFNDPEGKTPLAVVGALPGNVDCAEGRMLHATHFRSWKPKMSLTDIIRERLNTEVPIFVDNWINFNTYAKKHNGQAENTSNFLLINTGYHGVSAGIVINGQIYEGQHFLAGEVGHMVIKYDDDVVCQCGGTGCLESLLNIHRLEQKAAGMQETYPDSMLFKYSDSPSLTTIIKGFQNKDPLGVILIEEIAKWLAIALSNICLLIDPQLIIIEGEYNSAGPEYFSLVQEEYTKVSMLRLANRTKLVMKQSIPEVTQSGGAAFAIDHHLNILGDDL